MRMSNDRRLRLISWLLFAIVAFACAFVLLISSGQPAVAHTNLSMRFLGAGSAGSAVDRVLIPIEPDTAADIGDTDSTIEFWMRGESANNGTPATVTPGCPLGIEWRAGNFLLSRYRFDNTTAGWAVSVIDDGSGIRKIAVGTVDSAGTNFVLCSNTVNVLDDNWHHIAITRVAATGALKIYIDGQERGSGIGAVGDISYPDGTPLSNLYDDRIAIAADQHDLGVNFNGYIDDLRLSNTTVYSGAFFAPPTTELNKTANTLALYRFNEGSGSVIISETANPAINGSIAFSTTPPSPTWTGSAGEIPPNVATLTNTPTNTNTFTFTPSPTNTPTSTLTPTASRTPTITLTASLTFTPSRTPTITRTPTASLTPTNTRPPTLTPSATVFKPPQATAEALPTRDRGGTATAAALAATETRAAVEATLATGEAALALTQTAQVTPSQTPTRTLEPGAPTFTLAPDVPAGEVGGGGEEQAAGGGFFSGGRLIIAGIVGVVLLGLIILLLVLLLAPRPKNDEN